MFLVCKMSVRLLALLKVRTIQTNDTDDKKNTSNINAAANRKQKKISKTGEQEFHCGHPPLVVF